MAQRKPGENCLRIIDAPGSSPASYFKKRPTGWKLRLSFHPADFKFLLENP